MVIVFIILGLMQIFVWLGCLVAQYFAFKNRRYRTVIICVSLLILSVLSCALTLIYGGFIDSIRGGTAVIKVEEENEFLTCITGFIWVVSSWFCWCYVYKRKTFEYNV